MDDSKSQIRNPKYQNGQTMTLHWKYTEEFKVEAMRLAESVGRAAAAKRLGVPDGNLRIGSKWSSDSPAVEIHRGLESRSDAVG